MSDAARPRIGLSMVEGINRGQSAQLINCAYIMAVYAAGGWPCPIPSVTANRRELSEQLRGYDALVFIGGRDFPPELYGATAHPETDLTRRGAGNDLNMMLAALESRKPLLGICAGCQLMNIATGGKLIQHIEHHRDTYHEVRFITDGRLAQIWGASGGKSLSVNSVHHQAINGAALGNGWRIAMVAGDGTVEAIEAENGGFQVGVQFHPERMGDFGGQLFRGLIAAI